MDRSSILIKKLMKKIRYVFVSFLNKLERIVLIVQSFPTNLHHETFIGLDKLIRREKTSQFLKIKRKALSPQYSNQNQS